MMRKSWILFILCLSLLIFVYVKNEYFSRQQLASHSNDYLNKKIIQTRTLASEASKNPTDTRQNARSRKENSEILHSNSVGVHKAKFPVQPKIIGIHGTTLENYLNSRSIKGNWVVLRDDSRNAFKMSGGEIPGLLDDPKSLLEFVSNLENQLELDSRHTLSLEKKSQGGRIEQIDFMQKVKNHLGQEFEVVDGWMRILGNKQTGNIFLIQNEMKKIESQVDLIPALTESETLNIAKDYLKDSSLKVSIVQKVFLYSGEEPSQLIFKVVVDAESASRILYVGHETKSVVYDSPTRFH